MRPAQPIQSDALSQPAVADNVLLHGLRVQLGPDLRVMYPMNVMNFGIGGEVSISGPAEPTKIKPVGTIRCAVCLVNLQFAPQLKTLSGRSSLLDNDGRSVAVRL